MATLLNVILSRNTIAERVDQLSINLKEQPVEKGKDFIAYSLAVDESTDISDIAQLSIFIRGVDSSLNATGVSGVTSYAWHNYRT